MLCTGEMMDVEEEMDVVEIGRKDEVVLIAGVVIIVETMEVMVGVIEN